MSAAIPRRVLGLGLAALLLLAGALLIRSTVRVPAGQAVILDPEGEAPRVVSGPAWALGSPLGPRTVRLDRSPRLREGQAAVLLTASLTARPDLGADPERLLEIARDPEAALDQAWYEGLASLEPGMDEDMARASMETVLRSRGWLPEELRVVSARVSRPIEDTGMNLLLVGIDSADWDRIDPLIAAGRLPQLARLRGAGAWATLRSDTPSLSPLLWTTAATGRPPDEHGIIDFVMVEPETGAPVPISSRFRRVKAFWNILSEVGMSVAVVGWWATWPAEPVEGVLISDRMAYSLFRYEAGQSGGATYPDSYFSRAAALKVEPWEISGSDLGSFARYTEADLEASTARLHGAAGEPFEDHLDSLRRTLAGASTYHRIALDLLRRSQPRVAAVYYQGLDEVNHRFAHLEDPLHPLATPEDRRAYGAAIEAYYELQDRMLGELLESVAPDTMVMVLSDHGFANGAERPRDFLPYVEAGRPGRWHTLDGIWILSGAQVRPGRLPVAVTLEQITPTILRILGLPLADDMPGSPVEAAFRPDFLEARPPRRIESYETGGTGLPTPAVTGGAADDEVLARLRALGYLGGTSRLEPGAGEGGTTATYHANLGVIRLVRGNLDGAAEAFGEALSRSPGNLTARGGMIQIDILQGRDSEALDGALKLFEETRGFDPVFYYVAAQLYVRTGRPSEGREVFQDLAGRFPEISHVRTGLGILLLASEDRERAAEEFRRALDRKPDALYALQELFGLEMPDGDLPALLNRIDAAIETSPSAVMPYNWRGLALRRMGRSREAEASFRAALEHDPDSVRSLVNLSSLLVDARRPEEAIPLLRRVLEQDPTAEEARVNLVVALGRAGRLPEAREEFEAAGGTDAGSTGLLNAMAFASYLNREPGEARELLDRSLAIDPDQPEAQTLRDRLGGGS